MTRKELNNSNVIKNISSDESEIIHSILDLYGNGADTFDADFTASTLNFYKKRRGWKYTIPVPEHLYDVAPSIKDRIEKITPFHRIPAEDDSFESICIDLPFVITPKTSKSATKDGANITAKRFGGWYPANEGYYNMYWWLKEAYRTLKPGGIVAYKMQSTVSGGVQVPYVPFSIAAAQRLGFYFVDEFHLQAKFRLIPAVKIKKQQHARKYTSSWLVFVKEKNQTKARKTNINSILDDIQAIDNEGKLEGYEFPVK